MPFKTAVIILNFNNHNQSLYCVESVLDSSLDAHILLVDNFSTLQERESVINQFSNTENLDLLLPKENLGFAGGVNLALKHAVKEGYVYFLLLNNDAILVGGAGDILSKAFHDNPGCLVAPTIVWGKNICRGSYYHKWFGLLFDKPLVTPQAYTYYLTGCALGFDKHVLDSVGLLNESFFMYGEDVEFSQRAHKKQIPLILLDQKLVIHSGSHSSRKASMFYEYHIARSHYLLSFYLTDHYTIKMITIFGKMIMLLMRACYRSIRHKSIFPCVALFLAPFQIKIRPKLYGSK